MISRATINEQIASCVTRHIEKLDDARDVAPAIADFLEAVSPLFERRDELDDQAMMAKMRF
jgi:hypothetical protein